MLKPFFYHTFKNGVMQNHHLTSVSTSPQFFARPIFLDTGPISATVTNSTSTVQYTVSNSMKDQFKLRLVFESGTAEEFKDCITHARGIDLYVRNIHTVQTNANTLVFESTRDRMYAMLLLSNDPLYTVHEID